MSKMSLAKRRVLDRGDPDDATLKKQPAVAKSSAESKGSTSESTTSNKNTKPSKSFGTSQQPAGGRLSKAIKYAMQRQSVKDKVSKGAKGQEGYSKIVATKGKGTNVKDMSDSECSAENISMEESDEGEYSVEIVPPTLSDTEEESLHENGEVSIDKSAATTQRLKKQMRGDYDINELLESAVATSQNGGSKEDESQKRTYKREFNIPCAYCEVMLKDYGYLFRHVTRLHKNEPDVDEYVDEIRPRMRTACPICNKTVSSASNVTAHIKQCHADTDCAVKCPLCKKSYKTQISLKQHIRQCHQPQVRKHKCNFCDMTFTENRSLREHINCTHETTQIFRCDDCGKTFLTKGRLRRHKYIHSDFRHYCTYCNKGFHLKDNMNKHVEIMHEKKFGKRFQCPHCPKSFTVKGNMKQHIMGVHLRQYAYSCPICGEGYRRKKDMLLHMEQHKEGMSTLKIEDVKIDPHTIKLPPPSVKVQMAPTDGSTTGTTVIEVLPQNIKVMTE